jgi:hypothetical protein
MPVDNEVYMGDDEMVVYRYDSEVVDKETGRMHSSSRVVVIEDLRYRRGVPFWLAIWPRLSIQAV